MKQSTRNNTRSGQQAKLLKGDPSLRYRVQQWIPLITILIIAGFAYVLHRLRKFTDVAGDPCVAAADLGQLLTISGTVATGLLGFVGLVLLWLSFVSLREGVFPPSVMPLVRDTLQRVAGEASVRAAGLAALGLVIMSAAAYGYMRVNALVLSLQAGC